MADLAPDLRVLSLWQPYATLWADPDLPKGLETRPKAWPSTIPLPAWVLIHASAKQPDEPVRLGGEFGVDVLRHPGATYVGLGVELERGDYYCYRRPNPPGKVDRFHPLPLGAVIGAAHVTACLPIVGMPPVARSYGEQCIVPGPRLALYSHDRDGLGSAWRPRVDLTADLPYGDYRPGRYGYLTDRTVLFDQPIPHKGKQWPADRATPELIAAVALQCPEVTRG